MSGFNFCVDSGSRGRGAEGAGQLLCIIIDGESDVASCRLPDTPPCCSSCVCSRRLEDLSIDLSRLLHDHPRGNGVPAGPMNISNFDITATPSSPVAR